MNRTAIYLRLSKEDLDKFENVSESIKNQKRMLLKKIKQENWQLQDIYIDEDYSGIDNKRPEFNRLIKNCESKKIDIVLCKSQSRFSRDMEVIEKYLHNKFILWNVRFVSLVDNADTNNIGNKKSRQINGLVNEWYLEDTSLNIKATLKNKKEAGLFTGPFAPFGYQKDLENKNNLVIDKKAALIVKKIFNLYNQGFSYQKIASYLNRQKIPSPYEYKKQNGSNFTLSNNTLKTDYIFKKGNYNLIVKIENLSLNNLSNIKLVSTFNDNKNIDIQIKKIDKNILLFNNKNQLKNDDYIKNNLTCIIPHLKKTSSIQYEIEVKTYQNKKYQYLTNYPLKLPINIQTIIQKKTNWTEKTISNILKNEIYIGNMVQGKYYKKSYKNKKVIMKKPKDWIVVKNTHEAIIDKKTWDQVQKRKKNKIRIDRKTNSLNPLSQKVVCSICHNFFIKTSNTNHKYEYLICKDKKNKWVNCNNKNSIRLDILNNIIIQELNKLIVQLKDDTILKKLNSFNKNNNIFKKINMIKKEYQKNNDMISLKTNFFSNIYEDKIKKIITEQQFDFLNQKYLKEINDLKNQNQFLLKKIKELENKFLKVNILNTDITFLTLNIINEFIDKIYIDKINNQNRNIVIVWKF